MFGSSALISPASFPLSPVQPHSMATTALSQLVQQQGALPSTPSSSLTLELRCTDPSEGGGVWLSVRVVQPLELQCVFCISRHFSSLSHLGRPALLLGGSPPYVPCLLMATQAPSSASIWAAIKNCQLSVFTSMGCCLPDDASALLLPCFC